MTIYPLGTGSHISHELGEILSIIDDSGLPYCLTPSGTCIEGEWEEVMAVVRRCHEYARNQSSHVIPAITIEDEEGATDKIRQNIVAVERAAGRRLKC